MLVKLTPDQVIKHWDEFKGPIAASLAPDVFGSDKQIDYTLNAIVRDVMQAWTLMEGKQMVALIITKFTGEPGIEIKNLMIFALVSVKTSGPILDATWMSGYQTLRQFAKKHECHKIIGFTNNPHILMRVTSLGGKVDTVLLALEV